MTTLRIATRKSPLALWQTEHVADRLRAAHPGLAVELVPMSTRGDEVLDRSLAAIGGKGLFLKELELAMQRGDADCAVHSLKDVPMELEPGFALPAILARAEGGARFDVGTLTDPGGFLGRDGIFRLRRDGQAEIAEGIAAGERIVIDGTGKLRPGVKVADAAPTAPAKPDAPAADDQG